jgi:hypothetical protein
MDYNFIFTLEQTQALWNCIQNAALPRAMTDDIARSFRAQIEAANREREFRGEARLNGHDTTGPS